ncbi:MAG: response regulator [Ignavibacteriaceae bacterium]|nr:response regulator [Ignavibacteriaceae bacterium]
MKKILIVENDISNAEVLKWFLKGSYELTIVHDGETAIQTAAENFYSAVLMDINLGGGLNGLETAQQIRSLSGYEEVPVIATTAFAMPNEKEQFLSGGCTHFIGKPIDKQKLLELLNETAV